MRDFVVSFMGGMGSTAVIEYLSLVPEISIVGLEQIDGPTVNVEPFDWQQFCDPAKGGFGKDISKADLFRCLDLIFDRSNPDYLAELRAVYGKYRGPVFPAFERDGKSIGFKMRPRSGVETPDSDATKLSIDELATFYRRHDLVVISLNRRDIARWAIWLHQESTAQFEVRKGLRRADSTFEIDLDKMDKAIALCEQRRARLDTNVRTLQSLGVNCLALDYEDFVADRIAFVTRILRALDIPPRPEHDQLLGRDISLKKVHSKQPHELITNYADVARRFPAYFPPA